MTMRCLTRIGYGDFNELAPKRVAGGSSRGCGAPAEVQAALPVRGPGMRKGIITDVKPADRRDGVSCDGHDRRTGRGPNATVHASSSCLDLWRSSVAMTSAP